MSYARKNIEALAAYTPGEQPEATNIVKLNTNENPYPPSQAVMQAIAKVSAESLRRYPPPAANAFRKLAARVHGLEPEQVIATNGGDELLRMLITVYCEPCGRDGQGGLGIAEPSYSLYPVLAAIADTSITRIALDEQFGLPADFGKQLNAAGCKLAMVVNPHAPSGRLESIDTLRQIAEDFNGVLVVDEAYVDFANEDAISLVRGSEAMPNVVLLRTLSKGYSLAGLRFGYGLGHATLIASLDKVRDSYNTDALAQAAAIAALENRETASQTWQKVRDERRRLGDALEQLGFDVLPSQSNFLLVRPGDGQAANLYRSLANEGIFVRYFDQDRLRDRLRITIGTPEQNDKLLDALQSNAARQNPT